MPRSLWRGAISFGLIYVPVNLFSASRENTLPMHLLDSRDFAPVGYHRINKVTGKEVDWPHIVKGYEYKKGQYVALSDADFKHANIKASETIEIASFTDADQIPPLYFETPYYLAPSKGGQKVYSLLRRALQATKKVAVATFVMRGRQHLCVVAPNEDMLVLLTLRFANEVLPAASVENDAAAGKSASISAAELTMAKRLVEGMSGPFKPNQFKDTYRDDLLQRVKEKIKKKQTHSLEAEALPESDRPKAQVIDLMEALRNSLAKNKGTARAAPKKVTRQRKRA
jgi:DNA end-binding protein Ku